MFSPTKGTPSAENASFDVLIDKIAVFSVSDDKGKTREEKGCHLLEVTTCAK